MEYLPVGDIIAVAPAMAGVGLDNSGDPTQRLNK